MKQEKVQNEVSVLMVSSLPFLHFHNILRSDGFNTYLGIYSDIFCGCSKIGCRFETKIFACNTHCYSMCFSKVKILSEYLFLLMRHL